MGDAMQFWVYILECADGRYHTGHTDDVEKRMAQHEAGKGGDFTRRRLPVRLAWSNHVGSREEALAFERQVEGWSRAKKAAWIAQDFRLLKWLSRPPSERAASASRPSTSLRTNESLVDSKESSLVRREVEGRATSAPTKGI